MLFQVMNKENKCVMRTEFVECIPDIDTLKAMSTGAEYKFKLDKKPITLSNLIKLLNSNQIKTSAETYKKQKEYENENSKYIHISDDTDMNSTNEYTFDDNWLESAINNLGYIPNTRTIYCEETKEIFKTQADAAKKYNLDPTYISYYIGKGESYNGYTFKKVIQK